MTDKDGETNTKSLMIFGTDVSKIPCFRNTYLYGILGGFGSGLTFFLFTSRVKASTDFAVAAFGLISLGYWMQCRYNYSKTKYEMMRLQEALVRRNLYEGTELEKKVEAGEKLEKFEI